MNSWKMLLLMPLLLVYLSPASAAVPSPDWKTLESEHFLVHFLPKNSLSAKRSVFIAERLYDQLKTKFEWEPVDKISMLLTDDVDSANGSATPIPFNLVKLLISPPATVSSLDDYDDWLTLLIEHELVHIFHLDKGRGKILKLRNTFGRFLLFFPNMLQPSWLVEGLAVYHETKSTTGRGQSNRFEMLMRAEIQRGFSPVSQVNLPADTLPLNRQYLYGVYFYQFLRDRYGEAAINALIDNYSDNILPFAINSNSEEILGKDISQLWDEFKLYMHKRFQAQINKLETIKPVAGKQILENEIQITNLRVQKDSSLLFVEDNYQDQAYLVKYREGKLIHLLKVNSGSYFDVMDSTGSIYLSQIDFCDEYHIYYDLYRYEPRTGDIDQLTECQRYRHFTVDSLNKQLYAVKTVDAIPSIDLLDLNGKKIKTLWTGQYGDVINQLDWSSSRQALLVTRKRQNLHWDIFEYKPDTADWIPVVENNSINMNASYSKAEDSILYSSDQTGVFNIYKKQFDNGTTMALTHVVGGSSVPEDAGDGSAYYLNFNADGYRIYRSGKTEAHPVRLKAPKQYTARYDDTQLGQQPDYPIRAYSPWPDLKPKYWFPLLEVQDKGSEIGFVTSSNDSLDHHFYELNFIYGVDQNELLGSFQYQYENWLGLLWARENSFYTDDAGGTSLIRANTQTQITLVKPFSRINSRWRFRLGMISNNDKDTYRASGVTGFGDNYDGLLGFSIYYDSKKDFLRSHSPEQGRDVLLVTESSDVFNSDYQGQLTTLEWQEYFKLGHHHVLALRLLKGQADITMRPYRLGGLETQWDDVSILNPEYSRDIFNKRSYALRGYEENTQFGNNIELYSLEYRFPLQQVERGIMTPPLGLIKHSGRIFTEAGASWNDGDQKNIIQSAGLEWVMETNLFYFFNINVRLGYAKGLDDTGDEFYYLKLGSAF